jgi:hypothetical protein
MAAEGALSGHEWAVLFDAASRFAEAVAVIFAALWAHKGVKIARRTADFLGVSSLTFWKRRRPARYDEDPVMDRLRAEKDDALGRYLQAASKVDHYASKPTEGKHR